MTGVLMWIIIHVRDSSFTVSTVFVSDATDEMNPSASSDSAPPS